VQRQRGAVGDRLHPQPLRRRRADVRPGARGRAQVHGQGPALRAAFFGTDLTGVELRATDADWSHGAGVPVLGRAQDLLLAVCGRRLPAGRLQGDAADRFTR
jgi:hypothetical protein